MVAFLVLDVASPRISSFLHSSCGFVETSSCDVCFLVPFAGELVSPWAFSTISRGYGIERHRLKPHDDLERTFAHSLALLKNVGELGNIQQLSPISLVSDHVVPQNILRRLLMHSVCPLVCGWKLIENLRSVPNNLKSSI